MAEVLLLTGLSTACAVVALAVSLWRVRLPKRKVGALELTIGDIEHDIESIRSSIRRLNARVGMREARAKKSGEETPQPSSDDPFAQLPGESNAEWKARMRKGPLRTGIRPR